LLASIDQSIGSLAARPADLPALSQWTPGCTHLICPFANTPKYHQAKADGGIVVRASWINACHAQGFHVSARQHLLDPRDAKLLPKIECTSSMPPLPASPKSPSSPDAGLLSSSGGSNTSTTRARSSPPKAPSSPANNNSSSSSYTKSLSRGRSIRTTISSTQRTSHAAADDDDDEDDFIHSDVACRVASRTSGCLHECTVHRSGSSLSHTYHDCATDSQSSASKIWTGYRHRRHQCRPHHSRRIRHIHRSHLQRLLP